MVKQQCNQETFLAQIGNDPDEAHRAISTPIYFSTAYRHEQLGHHHGYDYARTGNPTRDVLEKAAADLEKGDKAFATSSGMAAVQLVFNLFEKGSHFVASRDIYGGSFRYFEELEKKYGFEFTYWDGQDETEIARLIKDNTKAIFIETPTNPLMQTTDIEQVAVIAREYDVLYIVDNTLYSPYIQRPIEQGADIVIHSATKYLAGHNDVLAGLMIVKGEELAEELTFLHNTTGAVLGPYDCWSVIRGMKTLALRMRQHERNASVVKDYLGRHELVTNVHYPGRGGMLSFELTEERLVEPFLQNLRIFTFAESLGGVESFITYPVTQTHADIPEEIRLSYGLSNRLLRVSVGIEHEDDLVADLQQALAKVSEREVETT